MSSAAKSTDYIRADTKIIGRSSFIMKFKIGTPPVDTYGYIDTGSGLSWVQCAPCDLCYRQYGQIYDRKLSSSYENVPSHDALCSVEAIGGSVKEDDLGNCAYSLTYADGSVGSGDVAKETFIFKDDYKVLEVIFGCSSYNPRSDYNPPALIGLGNLSASLVRQLSISQFYYHVETIEGSNHMVGTIDLGERALDPLSSIPLLPNTNKFYYLALNSISVAGYHRVSRLSTENGIVLDSGSTYTSVESDSYREFVRAIIIEMGAPFKDPIPAEICYPTILQAPTIVFEFENLNITLCQSNVWYRMTWPEQFCLAIKESPKQTSIFGMYQQRSMKVAYDLDSGRVSMTPMKPDVCPDFD
ncbi:hypothetical protein LguiA_015050 [Lonicera macranthoides]